MTNHVPVLLEECLTLLAPQDGRAYLDCTFGGGGHTAAIFARAPRCTIDAMDRDPAAADRSAALLAAHPGSLRFHSENFRHLDRVPGRFDGVLMDIGVSSYQLDVPERGFSFRFDAPNDWTVRMLLTTCVRDATGRSRAGGGGRTGGTWGMARAPLTAPEMGRATAAAKAAAKAAATAAAKERSMGLSKGASETWTGPA
jgi:hypothetical protein